MLVYFPDGKPDELLYSMCAKYVATMKYALSNQSVVEDLFGASHARAVVDLPSRINHLISVLPHGHQLDANLLLAKHTMLPFYGPFLPDNRYDRIKTGMLQKRNQGVHLSLGIIGSQIALPKFLQYCPICYEQDRNQYSEAYWHRIHQAPGVFVCPEHEVWLESTKIPSHGSHAFVVAEAGISNLSPRFINEHDIVANDLLMISQSVSWLLNKGLVPIGLDDLKKRYLAALISRGFATHSGRVRTCKLIETFKKRYTSELLKLLNCEISGHSDRSWLARMVQTNQPQSPVRHLLLIHLLEYTLEEFFKLETTYTPFGNGPWLCLNPVCPKHKKATIKEFQLGYSLNVQRRPVGTFACLSCGFTYSRIGPDLTPADSTRISRIIKYGRVWDEELERMWFDLTIPIKDICTRLGVHYETVRRHLHRLGLSLKRDGSQRWNTSEIMQETGAANLDLCRQLWLKEINREPQPKLFQLIQTIPQVYRTLYQLDAEWLNSHKPQVNRKRKWSRIPVDWDARDRWLVNQVDGAVRKLKNQTGRPVRITVNAIGREVGWQDGKLQSALSKMPHSAKLIAQVIETHERFALRRIEGVKEFYSRKGLSPSKSELIKRAGLSLAVQTPQVLDAIEQIILKLRFKD